MASSSSFDSRFAAFKPNPDARVRVFCFPNAGGGAAPFRKWVQGVTPDLEICPIQLPGRENRLRERAYTELSPLIDKLVDVLQPFLDVPFAFFGHSMGGLISFELARRLRKEGRDGPIHIFVAAVLPPEQLEKVPPIYQLPDDAFIETLRTRYAGLAEPFLENSELLNIYLPVLRADLTLLDTYTYRADEPLECPISAFGGMQDWVVTQEDVAAWRAHTRGPFKMRMFPGGHFFINESRMFLLQALSRDLMQSVSGS